MAVHCCGSKLRDFFIFSRHPFHFISLHHHFWCIFVNSPAPHRHIMVYSDTESNASSPGYFIPRCASSTTISRYATCGSLSSCEMAYHKSLFSVGDEQCSSFFVAVFDTPPSPLPLHKAPSSLRLSLPPVSSVPSSHSPLHRLQRSVTVAGCSPSQSSSSTTNSRGSSASGSKVRELYMTAIRRWSRKGR